MSPPYTIIKEGADGLFRWQFWELDHTDPVSGVDVLDHSASSTIQGYFTYKETKKRALRVLKTPGMIYQQYGESYYYQDDSDRWFPAEG